MEVEGLRTFRLEVLKTVYKYQSKLYEIHIYPQNWGKCKTQWYLG